MASANQAPTTIDYALQLAAGTAAILALSFGGDPSASNRTGLYGDLTASAEKIAMVVGGQTGPIYTRSGTDVNVAISGAMSLTKQFTSTLATGTAPFVVASTTAVANLNASLLLGSTWASPGTIGSTTPSTGKFTSVTNTGLTVSGGVVFGSAAGLMQVGAGLTYSSNALTVGDGTAAAQVLVNGAAGSGRQLLFRTNGSTRWSLIGANATAEGGGSSGSEFRLVAADDTGVTIDTPIAIARPAGSAITFSRPLQPGSGSASAPSYAFSTDTTTGFYRAASGTIGYVASGTEIFRLSTTFVHNRNAVAIGTAPITSISTITIHGADASSHGIAIAAYGGSPTFFARRTEGTAASPTQSVNGSSIFILNIQGYEGTTPGFSTARNAYLINARESFTSAAQGYCHIWNTTASGTTTNSEKMRLENSGNLLLGTTTDGMTAAGSLAIAQDLAHRGTKVGFYNRSPQSQLAVPTIGAMTVSGTAGSSYTSTEQGMINALKADVATLRAGIIAVLNKLDQTAGTVGLLSGTAT